MNSVLIVAAEASSSLYAQRLLEIWKTKGVKVDAFGIGSREMETHGFEIIGRSEDMAVVGLQEVIKHFSMIKEKFERLLEEAERRRPKFALLLDYPGFNLRLAKKLHAKGIRVIYYISPQVWAWRTGRVHDIRKNVDRMLVLFPFEKDFFDKHNVNSDFVGHPILDELAPHLFDETHRLEHRRRFGLQDGDVVLGLMPGSRRSEVQHHFATQIEAARHMMRLNPQVKPVLFIAPSLDREDFSPYLSQVDFQLQMIREEPFDMIQVADVILCASGTATLMVGLMEKPMVIMYRMNPITAFFARLLVRSVKFFGMVNVIMNRMVVPELFQSDANPERLAKELNQLVVDKGRREQVVQDLKDLKTKLGSKGASLRVIDILSGYLEK